MIFFEGAGDQILVEMEEFLTGSRSVPVIDSRTVKDLVAGSGITFEDFGTHTLKGVPDDWQLFRVTS